MYNKKITIYMLILISSNIFGMQKHKHKINTKKLVNTALEVLKTVNSSNEAHNIQKTITKNTPILNTNTLSNITKQDSITEFTVKIKSLIKDVNNTDSKKETRTFNGKQSEGSLTSSSSFFVPYSSKNQNTSKSLTNFYDFRNFDTDINLRATLEKLAQNNQLKSYSETVNNTTITHYFGPESNTSILSTFNNGNTKGIILNKITINNFEDITNNSWSTPTFSLANCPDDIKNGSVVFLSDGKKGAVSFIGKIAILVPTPTNNNQTYNKDWLSNIFEKELTPDVSPAKNSDSKTKAPTKNNPKPAPAKKTEPNNAEPEKPKQGLITPTNFDKCSQEELDRATNKVDLTVYPDRTNTTPQLSETKNVKFGNNNCNISTDNGSILSLVLYGLKNGPRDVGKLINTGKERWRNHLAKNFAKKLVKYGVDQPTLDLANNEIKNNFDNDFKYFKVLQPKLLNDAKLEIAESDNVKNIKQIFSNTRTIEEKKNIIESLKQILQNKRKNNTQLINNILELRRICLKNNSEENRVNLTKAELEYAENRAIAEVCTDLLSEFENQLDVENKNIIKQTNQNNLNTATTQYEEKVQENATSENTTYSDNLLEKVLGEQVKIAKQVLDRNPDQQQQNITYDITGFDPSFVDKFALTGDQLDLINTGTALQGYNQNVLIYLLKKAENLDQLKLNNPHLYLLLDSSIRNIKSAIKANNENDLQKTNFFINCASATIELTRAAGEGLIEGVVENLMHTGKFVHDAIHDPKGTAGKLLTQTKETLAVMAKISFALDDLSGEIPQQYSNSEKTALEFKEYAEKLVAVIGKEWKETDKYKITKAVFKFFSSAYVDGEKFAIAGKFAKILRTKGKIVAEDAKKLFTRTSKKVVDKLKNPFSINTVTEGFVAPNGVVKEVEKEGAKVIESVVAKGTSTLTTKAEIDNYIASKTAEIIGSAKTPEETANKIVEATKELVKKLAPEAAVIDGITIDKVTGNIIINSELASAKYVERLKKLGFTEEFAHGNLKHIRHGHYSDGSNYCFKLIKNGTKDSIFNHNENFIELALQVCEKGTKLNKQKIVYDFGRIIGFDMFGMPTSKAEVWLTDTLNGIRTVYPTTMGK